MTGLLSMALFLYGLPLLGLIIIIWVGKTVYDKRYKQHEHPRQAIGLNADYRPTKEIYIDPRDGNKYQVYYNPHTGDRQYIRVD